MAIVRVALLNKHKITVDKCTNPK